MLPDSLKHPEIKLIFEISFVDDAVKGTVFIRETAKIKELLQLQTDPEVQQKRQVSEDPAYDTPSD